MSQLHKCERSAEIDQLKIDVAVAKSDISKVKVDISGINEKLDKFTWWFLSLLVATIGGMATILLKLK